MTDDVQPGMDAILKAAPVIPVMVIENVADAVPLARALVKGGLPVLEITLRTKAALECIRAIIAEVEGAIVGAGTVLDGKKLKETEHIGCAFAVSPGATKALLDAAEDAIVPLLPGSASASECMSLMERGYRFQKFFPCRSGRRRFLSRLSRLSPAASKLLPDRRHYAGVRSQIFEAAERNYGWRFMDGPEEIDRGRRLGGD